MKTVRFLVILIMITLFSIGSTYAARMVDKNSTVSTAPVDVKQQGKAVQKETANTPDEEGLSA